MRTSWKKWSEAEIESLRRNNVVSTRTINAIRSMRSRLGFPCNPRPRWLKEDADKLKELVGAGLSARKIHKMSVFSCSLNAIQKQMCRMGLAKKLKVFKYPIHIRRKFENFLVRNWEGRTPADLVEIWDKENARYPTNRRKVCSYLTRLNIKIPYWEVQKINNLRKKERQIKIAPSGNVIEKIRAERVKMMQGRFDKNRDLWNGSYVGVFSDE